MEFIQSADENVGDQVRSGISSMLSENFDLLCFLSLYRKIWFWNMLRNPKKVKDLA